MSQARVFQNDPRHERAYQMALQGMTLSQISEVMKVKVGTLAMWSSRDRWQERIEDERLNNQSILTRRIADALSRETLVSIQTLADLRDNERVPPAVRAKCASDLIGLQKDIGKFLEGYARVAMLDAQAPPVLALAPPSDAGVEMTDEEIEERQRLRVQSA